MTPPRLAEWIVGVTIPAADREAVLGDLAEDFSGIASQTGGRLARRWYWRQALRSIGTNLRRRWRLGQPPSRRRRFGEPHVSGSTLMQSVWQDVRFGARMLRRRPFGSVVAGGSLVVGVALSAVVFSLLDAAVLRSLPVRDPASLVVVLSQRTDSINHNFSYPDFIDYRAQARALTDLAAFSATSVTVRRAEGAMVVPGELVSGSYFGMFGVGLRAGRGIIDSDLAPGAPPVAVVSEGLWRTLSGGRDAPFAPRQAVLNTQSVAIVGVTESRFRGMQIGREARLWAPLTLQRALSPRAGEDYSTERRVSWLTVMGRLAPGATMTTAAVDLNRAERAIAPAVGREQPRPLLLAPGAQGDSRLPAQTASPLQLLLGAALLVLVVACANVANLLVARTSDRRRELAVRAALGASRARLVRLLLVEASIIGLGSAAVALAIAVGTTGWVAGWISGPGGPAALDVGLDWRLTGFVVALGLGATLLAGLAPALSLRPQRSSSTLADGGRAASAGAAGTQLRRGLVVVQFALSLALVVTAALLMRTLYNVRTIATGLALNHVALFEVDPEGAGVIGPRLQQYYVDAERRLAGIPGVTAAGYGRIIPIGFGGSRVSLAVPGYTPRVGEEMEINYNLVSPGYLDTVGIAIRDGRVFGADDVTGRPGVAVVNETMALRYWPDGRAVGRTFAFDGPNAPPSFEVVGVVSDVKYRTLREEAGPSFYLPVAQRQARSGVMHVRTAGSLADMLDTLRRALAEVDATVPITQMRTLRDQAALNAADEALAVVVGGGLAGAALLLAAVGLFAAMSYSVSQRTREIGVRIALGAVPPRVRSLVLGESLRLALVGGALGTVLAVWLGQLVAARLYGVSPLDVASYVAAALVLGAVAVTASWAPARRAARVNPIEALRGD